MIMLLNPEAETEKRGQERDIENRRVEENRGRNAGQLMCGGE
jgi:hypothetical protein